MLQSAQKEPAPAGFFVAEESEEKKRPRKQGRRYKKDNVRRVNYNGVTKKYVKTARQKQHVKNSTSKTAHLLMEIRFSTLALRLGMRISSTP